jgi:hypothetical protein
LPEEVKKGASYNEDSESDQTFRHRKAIRKKLEYG